MSSPFLPPLRHGPTGWHLRGSDAVHPLPDRLRVVTLNTWFAPTDRSRRLDAQLHILDRLRPDIIALQEVTEDLLLRLLDAPWLQAAYAIPQEPTRSLHSHGYGTFLAVRPAVQHFCWHPFETSAMGRSLLHAQLPCGLRVGTVHLESLSAYGAERARQLDTCTAVMTGPHPSVLVGDFNFDDTDPDAPVLHPWTDLWSVCHPHNAGFTVDSTENPYRQRRGTVHQRIDRVLLHDPTHQWRVQKMERFGREPAISGVLLSDHFGLLTDLRRVATPPR